MRTWIKLIGCFHILWKLLIINQREQKPLHHHLIMGEHLAGSTHRILICVFLLLSAACLCVCTCLCTSCKHLLPAVLPHYILNNRFWLQQSKMVTYCMSDIWNPFTKSNYLIIMECQRKLWAGFSEIKNSGSDFSVIGKCRLVEGQDLSLHTWSVLSWCF